MSGNMTADGLANVVAGLGTERDKAAYSHYSHSAALSRYELENMYRSSWLAKRIVNSVADDMTREGWRHFFDGEEQFAVEAEETKLGIKDKVNQTIKDARLYGGAALVLGINGEALRTPLNLDSVKRGSLKWVLPVDRYRMPGTGTVTVDPESPNFGLPEMYLLANQQAAQVHWTRVIRFEGQRLPYYMFESNGHWHDSELQHVYSAIRNSDTASASIGTMLFESNVDVIKMQGLAEQLAMECGENQVIKRFQLAATMKSFNRALILDESETYEKKSNNFSNLDAIWRQFFIEVCGAADIPMVRLFGQSAAGLNATGDNDIRNYYDMVSSQQESDLRPALNRLMEVLVRSALGRVPEDYRLEFRSLWQLSDKEQAEIGKIKAERDNIYLQAGVVSEGVVARELREDGTYSTLTDEDVKLAEELNEPINGQEE